MLRRFEVLLDEGHITAKFNAGGNIEIIAGHVQFDVNGEVHVSPTVSGGVIIDDIDVLQPNVSVSSTGFTGDLVSFFTSF